MTIYDLRSFYRYNFIKLVSLEQYSVKDLYITNIQIAEFGYVEIRNYPNTFPISFKLPITG